MYIILLSSETGNIRYHIEVSYKNSFFDIYPVRIRFAISNRNPVMINFNQTYKKL